MISAMIKYRKYRNIKLILKAFWREVLGSGECSFVLYDVGRASRRMRDEKV